MKGYCGHTVLDGHTYRITIDSSLDDQSQFETLTHEWAHVLAINEAYRHGKLWGDMYSHVYEFVEEHWPDEGESE
jgi:hypothetical protein